MFLFPVAILSLSTLLSLTANASLLSSNRRRATIPSFCTDPPRDTCNFYSECLESQYHCGPDGYPLKYGDYFCEKFRTERSKLSARGQTWMLDTMECLQHTLVPEVITTTGVTCSSLEDKAFASHARCYIVTGLCTLPLADWLAIMTIVDLKTIFGNKDAFLATLQTGVGCVEAYLYFAVNWLET